MTDRPADEVRLEERAQRRIKLGGGLPGVQIAVEADEILTLLSRLTALRAELKERRA